MGLYPRAITEYLAGLHIPRSPDSRIFLVDPTDGNDNNLGDRWTKPLKTVAAAYAKCTAGRNDIVLLVPRAAANAPTAPLVWAKDYTHLVGLSGPQMPGLGQRCRIINSAANDLAVLFTLSGRGCLLKGIQFFDGKDKDEDGACVLVSGAENYLEGVWIAGMGHGTPAARAGSYSLKVTGALNYFKDCTIGNDTMERSNDPSEIIIDGGSKARFEHCLILTRSESATTCPVSIVTDDPLGLLYFEDCLFVNTSTNWATSLTNCMTVAGAGQTHYVVLRGQNQLVGITGWADTVTRVYMSQSAPDGTGGTNVAPTT